jgi:hypothetical protein
MKNLSDYPSKQAGVKHYLGIMELFVDNCLYGIILCMCILSVRPGLNSMVTFPLTSSVDPIFDLPNFIYLQLRQCVSNLYLKRT